MVERADPEVALTVQAALLGLSGLLWSQACGQVVQGVVAHPGQPGVVQHRQSV